MCTVDSVDRVDVMVLTTAMSVRICPEELFVLLFMSSMHSLTSCETTSSFAGRGQEDGMEHVKLFSLAHSSI